MLIHWFRSWLPEVTFALLGLALLALVMTAVPAAAQQGAPAPGTGEQSAEQTGELERQRLETLLATLENDAARTDLVQQIRTLLEVTEEAQPALLPFLPQAETIGAQGLTYLSDQIGRAGGYASALGGALMAFPEISNWFLAELADPRTRTQWIDVATSLLLIIGVAVAARLLAIRFARPPARTGDTVNGQALAVRAAQLGIAGLLDLIPLIAFVVSAYLALSIIDPSFQVRLVALAVINASAITGLVAIVVRMILTPRRPHLRLFSMDDETCAYLYVWLRRIVFTAVYGFFFAEAGQALGMPLAARNALLVGVGALVALMLIVVVLQNRTPVADIIRGPETPRRRGRQPAMLVLRRRFGDVWHIVAVLYIIANFTIFALDVEGGFVFMLRGSIYSAAVVVLTRLAIWAVDLGLKHLFSVKADLAASYPMLEKRANLYIPVVSRTAKGAILIIALLSLLEIWSLGGFAWIQTEFGQSALSSFVSIAIILLLAVIAWEMISNAVERRLTETDEDGNLIQQTGRTRTLLPLLRNAFLVILITIVSLIVLSEIGVNIAPLLAGAGVIGLAVGFGAQALVRDVITGLFILFEDWFNVGDVVDIGGKSGVVETMTIRTVRLRDVSGNVHTIQFGDVTTATNMTKEFSYAVIDIGVAYRENTDHVIVVLREVGEDLKADADYGVAILEPLDVLGVDSFGDSSVNIRVRFKTLPIKQWWVAREFRRRVKLRFDELGIEIPFPHTTLYFGEDKNGAAPAARVSVEPPQQQPPAPVSLPPSGPATPGSEETANPEPSADDYKPIIEDIEQDRQEEEVAAAGSVGKKEKAVEKALRD